MKQTIIALSILSCLILLGCDDTPSTTNRHQEQPVSQHYVIGGKVEFMNIYQPNPNNPQWYTHVGFLHNDGVMQELNFCDDQQLIKPYDWIAVEMDGVPGTNGCYTIKVLRKLY